MDILLLVPRVLFTTEPAPIDHFLLFFSLSRASPVSPFGMMIVLIISLITHYLNYPQHYTINLYPHTCIIVVAVALMTT